MNIEVAGSILAVVPVKMKKGLSFARVYVQGPVKIHPLKNNDETNAIIASHSNTTEKVGGKIGNWVSLIGVPDIIWKICDVQWGRMWWKIEFRRQKTRCSICYVPGNIFSHGKEYRFLTIVLMF